MMEILWKKTNVRQQTHVHTDGRVCWLTFDALEKETWLQHLFSTRSGGVSEGCLSEMNLSFTQERGEEGEKNVRRNFEILASTTGFSTDDMVMSDQTHTTNVIHVTEKDRGRGWSRDKDWKDVDGFVTDTPGVMLATFYADCVPLYFADPVHRAIGLSHSGWRGTAGKIGKITVEKMKSLFGTEPEELICVIGPSICRDCYEVSQEVADQFPESCLAKKENGKWQLDLWRANSLVLREAGVRPDKIFLPEICTCCNPAFLFSHRASGGKRGNLGAFIGIKAGP